MHHHPLALLLQAQPLPADTLSRITETDVKTVTLADLVLAGGPFMVPIVLLLLLAIYIFVERYLTIRRSNPDPEPLMRQVSEYIRHGDVQRALMVCEAQQSPFSRMLAKGLRRLGSPLPDIFASIENEGKLEINRLEKSLSLLATISGAAPMVGFLGTVTGLISAFMTISQFEGTVSPSLLAGGIYEAMVTTAAGLIVGIPAYVGYNILTNMIANVISKMELISTQFIDILQEPAR